MQDNAKKYHKCNGCSCPDCRECRQKAGRVEKIGQVGNVIKDKRFAESGYEGVILGWMEK